jgi:hypothetical protein
MRAKLRTTRLTWICSAALPLLGCADGADDGPSVGNPSLDNWGCGNRLCDWDTSGSVEKTSTWHKRDLGASFLESNAQISQHVVIDEDNGSCIVFDTIADLVPEALVYLHIDFNDDGVRDVTQQITGSRWQSMPFVVRTPVAYDGLRLSIVKEGTGHAVLAQIRLLTRFTCGGDPFTLAEDSLCSANEVCTSGRCEGGHCQPCADARCTSLTPARSSE